MERPGGTLTGTLVVPADAAYPNDACSTTRYYSPHPAAIAYCATPTDVQRCVAFARHTASRWRPAPVATATPATRPCPGLVDRRLVAQQRVGPYRAAAQATSAPAPSSIDIYSQLGILGPPPPRRLVSHGGHRRPGARAGAIGVFGRDYGLTCDNIASLDVVTADGTLRTCSPSSNSDLYWACRGGGGGNFGIVTSFTFTRPSHPSRDLFTLEWPWAEAADVLEAWMPWIPTAPRRAVVQLPAGLERQRGGGGYRSR